MKDELSLCHQEHESLHRNREGPNYGERKLSLTQHTLFRSHLQDKVGHSVALLLAPGQPALPTVHLVTSTDLPSLFRAPPTEPDGLSSFSFFFCTQTPTNLLPPTVGYLRFQYVSSSSVKDPLSSQVGSLVFLTAFNVFSNVLSMVLFLRSPCCFPDEVKSHSIPTPV